MNLKTWHDLEGIWMKDKHGERRVKEDTDIVYLNEQNE